MSGNQYTKKRPPVKIAACKIWDAALNDLPGAVGALIDAFCRVEMRDYSDCEYIRSLLSNWSQLKKRSGYKVMGFIPLLWVHSRLCTNKTPAAGSMEASPILIIPRWSAMLKSPSHIANDWFQHSAGASLMHFKRHFYFTNQLFQVNKRLQTPDKYEWKPSIFCIILQNKSINCSKLSNMCNIQFFKLFNIILYFYNTSSN